MNIVIYYSNTNESKRIAEYLGGKLSYQVMDIHNVEEYTFKNVVLIFPVHCQNIPQVVMQFLERLNVANLTVIATYGKMCHGNVLWEIQHKFTHNIVAAAYIPTKHTYIDEAPFGDFSRLDKIVCKVDNSKPVKIPKSYKNPLSNAFKGSRSRIGVKIIKTDNCDNCGLCQKICYEHAIQNGKTNNKCIRCLRCVANCPKHALTYKPIAVMRAYLKKKKQNELVIYV